MNKNNQMKNEILSQEQHKEKRKYTKHNYFLDLDKKLRIWKSILTEVQRVGTFYKKHASIDLSGTQEEVLKYIIDFDSKEGKLLSSSEKIQQLYAELQELLNQEGQAKVIFDRHNKKNTTNIMVHFDCNMFIQKINELFQDKSKQKQRIQCIQALLKHEKKQFQLETKIKEATFGKRQEKNVSYEPIPTDFEQSVIKRIDELRKRIIKDEREIQDIEKDLQRRAKDFTIEGDSIFSKDIEQSFIKECQEIYPELENALVLDYKLKKKLQTALALFKKTVEQEKTKLIQQKLPQKVKEKTSEEKVQEAFTNALEENKNLVLMGTYRSLGLTNVVIGETDIDEEYKQDIIEHILGFLDTPQGQDFGKSGNSRWRPVLGTDLYELSVNPKKVGHSQKMPRLYAKKELFARNGNSLELTSKKEKNSTESIWVLVRKGTKRTQENDIDMAEKVYFKNDGKQHYGYIIMNDLGWEKIDLRKANLPQREISSNNRSR